MRPIYINVVTYVPKGSKVTRLESDGKLIKSLQWHIKDQHQTAVINVFINNSLDPEISVHLLEYLNSQLPTQISHVYRSDRNNLMIARNELIREAYLHDPSAIIMQLDDDDRVTEDFWLKVNAIQYRITNDPLFQNRLNFYMFTWEKYDGDYIMPKDIDLKPISELGKSTFTFSNWGWIACADYLINNHILYPEFCSSPKLDDNFFHIRSHLVNNKANYILTPLYIWNSRDNKSSVSNRKWEYVDDLMDYFKSDSVGYDCDVYRMNWISERNTLGLEKIEDLKDFSYRLPENSEIYIKGLKDPVKVEDLRYNEVLMCYLIRYNNKFYRLRNIINAGEYMRKYSTHQLRIMAKMDPLISKLRELITLPNEQSINRLPNYDEAANKYIADIVCT